MKDKEKTEIMLKELQNHYSSWGRERTNIIFPELRLGSGYCGVAQRRIDLFIISSNAGNPTIAFEIKASRGDFKKDINDDLKQRGARLYANEFYYVAPKGMIKRDEVPLWAGLVEFDFEAYEKDKEKNGYYLSWPVSAPLMPKYVPSWGLICSMVRHINKDLGTDAMTNASLKSENRKLTIERNDMKKLLTNIASKWTKDMDEHIYWNLMKYRELGE